MVLMQLITNKQLFDGKKLKKPKYFKEKGTNFNYS